MALASGTRLGRYEILQPLGKGGMGEVYRSKDTQLGREVAVKVLSQNLADDPQALKRFEREARAVAALSHPNILEIHDSGTDQGMSYAVMELLEGETLRSRMNDSMIPQRKSLEIAAAVIDGLAAAHSKGIVHRDLKPENIFLLKDGRIKILDFGLARLNPVVEEEEITEASTRSQVTGLNAVLGTVPYMSPEQVRGESLDARSDIFSMGSILYEMLAGKRPFSGSNKLETIAAILKDDPPMPPSLPAGVERIVKRCLEKNPENRFHSAHDLAFALKDTLSTAGTVPSISPTQRQPTFLKAWIVAGVLLIVAGIVGWKLFESRKKSTSEFSLKKISSVAVLPLDNLSGDEKQQYFADGMTEELIAKLARIRSLRVISRTSVMEYKNARKPLPEIANELNVDAIVEGSVRQAGNRVRITAQLIHGPTDHHIWANSYEGDLENILQLQNEVASAIANEIQIELAPEEAAGLKTAPQVNPAAYQAYLRGLTYAEGEVKQENLYLAVEMFQKSVDLDPKFASAYAQLGRAQSFVYFTFDQSPERLAKAKLAIDRAFELQPNIAEGHLARGFYYYWGFQDNDRALQELRIAKKTLPNDKLLLGGEGAIYRRQGKFEEALEVQKRLQDMSPRDPVLAYDIGITYTFIRKYAEAQTYFDLCISLGPDLENCYGASAMSHVFWKANTTRAREILQKAPVKSNSFIPIVESQIEFWDRKYQAALDAIPSDSFNPFFRRDIFRGLAYRFLNKPDLARASFDTAREIAEKELVTKSDNANLHEVRGIAFAALGRKEDAIREGRRAVELLPVTKDAMWGPRPVQSLALIYVLTGEEDAAIDQIEYLLSIPYNEISIPILRIDPRWDPLRDNPRFQKLLKAS